MLVKLAREWCKTKRAAKRKAKPPSRRPLWLERLEDRVVPAAPTGLLVAGGVIAQYNPTTGGGMGGFASEIGGPIGPQPLEGFVFGPNGNLFATDLGNRVEQYDGTTGVFINTFVASGSAGTLSRGIAFGANGNLLVSSVDTNSIKEFDGATGAYVRDFVAAGSGGLSQPDGITFSPYTGNLLVGSENANVVKEYNGLTGAYIRDFATGVTEPTNLVFGPNGNLFVSSLADQAVDEFDGRTGAFISTVASGEDWQGLAFYYASAHANLYVTDFTNANVARFDGVMFNALGTFRVASSPVFARFGGTPSITSVPSVDALNTTVTVNGTNFTMESRVSVNGVSMLTTYISPTQISFTGPGADGNYDVSVYDPNGGTSNVATLTVEVPITNLTGVGATQTISEGGTTAPITGLATFTDPAGGEPNAANPSGTPNDYYTTVIHWGDGTTSPGDVVRVASIDTTIGIGPTGSPFGVPDVPTIGQTITAPVGGAVLTSFTFKLNLPSTVAFRGEVYAWNGTQAIGASLFESVVTSTNGSGTQLITFNIPGGVSLTSGQQYVLFISTSKDQAGHSGAGTWGIQTGDQYHGGDFVALRNGADNGAGWTAPGWFTAGAGVDMAFKATFTNVGSGDDFRIDAPSHTYADSGTYAVTVDVTHATAPTQTVTGASITVNDPNVTVNPNSGAALAPIDEGSATPAGVVIGTFADIGNPSGTFDASQVSSSTAEYTAVIAWGDGNSTSLDSFTNLASFNFAGANTWQVLAPAHTYAEEGSFNITLTVTHHSLPAVGPVQTDSITVNDPNVTVNANSGAVLSAIDEAQATPANTLIGTFADIGNPAGSFDASQVSPATAEYTAVIAWGDGQTDTLNSFSNPGAFVSTGSGNFNVLAPAHTYGEEGSYNISLTVTHHSLPAVGPTQTDSIVVNDPNVTVNANSGAALSTINEAEATPAGVVIGTFNDPGNPSGTFDASQTSPATAEYTAVITWGDGQTDTLNSFSNPGAFVSTGSGNFNVIAPAHTYGEEGSYNISLTVTHHSMPLVGPAQTDSIVVNEVPVTVNPNSGTGVTITEGKATPANTAVGTFTDLGNPSGTFDPAQTSVVPEYKVVINWGDGHTTTLDSFNNPTAFSPVGSGVIRVLAPAHIYVTLGGYNITMSVTHLGLAAVGPTQTDHITVLNAALIDTTPATTTVLRGGINSGTRVVTTFTDKNSFSPVTNYTVIIDWGDGTHSVGIVQLVSRTAAGSLWRVVGNHTYPTPVSTKIYTVKVTVKEKGGASFTSSKTRFQVGYVGRGLGH